MDRTTCAVDVRFAVHIEEAANGIDDIYIYIMYIVY